MAIHRTYIYIHCILYVYYIYIYIYRYTVYCISIYIIYIYMVTTPPRTYLEHWPWEALPCQDPGPIALGHMHLALSGSWRLLEEVPASCQRQRQTKSGKTVLKIWVQNCRKLWFDNFIGSRASRARKRSFATWTSPPWPLLEWWAGAVKPCRETVPYLKKGARAPRNPQKSRDFPVAKSPNTGQIGWDLQITYAIIYRYTGYTIQLYMYT